MRVAVENVSREVEPLVIARRSLVITPLYIQHNLSQDSSLMSHHGTRFIRLLQIYNIFFRQLDLNAICKQEFNPYRHMTQVTETMTRTNQILEFLDTRTANDWRCDSCQRPRQGDLCHAYAALLGYFFDPSRILMGLCSQTQTEPRTC